MKILIYIIKSCLITLLSSCWQDRPEVVYKINKEFHPFFTDFKMGSYWIYQNEINHKLDSIYIIYKIDEIFSSFNRDKYEAKRLVFDGYSMRGNPIEFTVSAEDEMKINIDIHSTIEKFSLVGFSKKDLLIEKQNIDNMQYEVIRYSNDFDLTQRKSGSNKGYPLFKSIVFAKGIGIIHFKIENDEKLGDASFRLVKYRAIL